MNKTIKLKTLLIGCIILLFILLAHNCLGLFSRYNYLRGLIDRYNENYQLIIVGELSNDVYNFEIAAGDFNFEYRYYGCIVSEAQFNGIEDYNAVMVQGLNQIYNEGWEKELIQNINELKEK